MGAELEPMRREVDDEEPPARAEHTPDFPKNIRRLFSAKLENTVAKNFIKRIFRKWNGVAFGH